MPHPNQLKPSIEKHIHIFLVLFVNALTESIWIHVKQQQITICRESQDVYQDKKNTSLHILLDYEND